MFPSYPISSYFFIFCRNCIFFFTFKHFNIININLHCYAEPELIYSVENIDYILNYDTFSHLAPSTHSPATTVINSIYGRENVAGNPPQD